MVMSFSFLVWQCLLSYLSFTLNPTWSVSLQRAWCLGLSLERELAGRWRTVLAARS